MTREELKHITDICFTIPMAIRRSGEKKTYHAEEIAEAKRTVMELIEQEPKTGHWNTYEIFQSGIKETWYECTKCKWSNALVIPRNYCPNCGARMREVSE